VLNQSSFSRHAASVPYDARMTDFITLPEQRVPVVAACDVLVVGGGAAGMPAAIAARRQGADVILVERYGYLGGLASGGLIVLLLTLDDGNGRQVIAGQCQELVERLEARGACFYPPPGDWGSSDAQLVETYRRWGLVWGSGPSCATPSPMTRTSSSSSRTRGSPRRACG
jgi:hypothetical protein